MSVAMTWPMQQSMKNADDGNDMTICLGLHTFAIAPVWDVARIERHMERLKTIGVGLFEIPLLRPAEIDIAATRDFAERHDMRLVASLGLPDTLDVGARPEEALDFLRPALDVTKAIGSDCLSGVTYATIGKTSGKPPTQTEMDGVCRFLDKAAREAGKRGLKLGIEPCNRYETHLLNTAAQARQCVERVGADNLFIHLDTYHMHIEEQGFARGFADALPYLGYVHLSESNRGVPGQGMVNWPACMAALKQCGYEGAMTLESMNHVDADIAGGLAIWRPVASHPDDVIDKGLPFLVQKAREAGLMVA